MAVLRVVVSDAQSQPVANARVVVKPYGKEVYQDGGLTLIQPVQKSTGSDGVATFTLTASSNLIPTNTPYWVERYYPGSTKPVKSLVLIPTGSASYDLEDILTDPPATLTSPALDAHRATVGNHDDVDLTGNAAGKVLMWDGTNFVPADTHATDLEVSGAITAHNADTTGVHGIDDTSDLVLDDDPRLTDARTPTPHGHPFSEITGTIADAQIPAAIARVSELATETTNRQNADATLQANIDAEASTRLAADNAESAARTTHEARTDNPHAVTKAQVGLGSVDNTSDANKPVSTAQQTALNLKAPRAKEVDPHLAASIEADLVRGSHQIVNAPAENIHAFVRAGSYVFGSHRTNPGRITRFHMDDLSDQATMVFPSDSRHAQGEALAYSRTRNRLYVPHIEVGFNRVVISEVNPDTMAASDFIDEPRSGGVGSSPAMVLTDDYLYVVTYTFPAKVLKYALANGALADEATLTNSLGHGLTHDGEFLYATGSTTGSVVATTPGWIAKLSLATLDVPAEVAFDANYRVPTDDLCVIGDYVYVGLEDPPGSTDGVIQRRRTSDLGLDQNIVVTGVGTAACYGTFWDGRYIWSLWATSPGLAVLIDPQTLEQRRFNFPTGENQPNEFVTDGRRAFFTHWGNPARVSRYTLPPLTGSASVAASAVSVTPARNIAATDVQSALQELDTEKTHDLGIVINTLDVTNVSNFGVASANDAKYTRVWGSGTISKVGLVVAVQSGNISVAIYRNNNGVPGTRVATTGAIACPAAGYQEVSLGGSYQVNYGDWFCITVDNTTATFNAKGSGVASALATNLGYKQTSAHPAPTNPASLSPETTRQPILRGVA